MRKLLKEADLTSNKCKQKNSQWNKLKQKKDI